MSLMMMRAALIARNALPPQYQRVEYIKGNSSQNAFLILPIDFNENYTLEMDIRMYSSNTEQAIGLSGTYGIEVYTASANRIIFYKRGRTTASIINPETKIKLTYKDYNFFYNGVSITNWTRNDPSVSYNISIMSYRNAYISSNGEIYSWKLSESGNTIMNLIPCRRKSDNKPGMWDTVSKTFYTSNGNGDFRVGPDVL